MGISTGGSGRKPGLIFDWPGTVAPPGAMALPTAPTNVSRSAYAKIFLAIGTVWGAGDGVNTFGLPWCAADQTTVQASGNVGTQTAGANKSHTHTATQAAHSHSYYDEGTTGVGGNIGGGATGEGYSGGYRTTSAIAPGITVYADGVSANLPAGARVLKCIQYA